MHNLVTRLQYSQIKVLFFVFAFFSTQLFADSNWNEQVPSTKPSARMDFGMSFDLVDKIQGNRF